MTVRGSIAVVFLLSFGVLVASAQSSDITVNEEIASKDGSPITFYGRVFGWDRGSPQPMNTQFPVGEDDYSLGVSTGCGTPPPAPDGTPTPAFNGEDVCDDWSRNELFWYTTAGFIQVKSWRDWGGDYSKFHNERGQTKDIYLDTAQPLSSVFHMSADSHSWSTGYCDAACWNWDPGYFPDWTVESKVWHASLGEWSQDPEAAPDMAPIVSGVGATLVAYGKTEPMDMWSLDPTIPVDQAEQTVWPFNIDYEWDPEFVEAGGIVPHLNDLIVQFEWFEETDGQIYIHGYGRLNWNINAGEDYPNSITFPVRNPLDVELVFPRFVHDKLVILSVLNTPWGSYDVDLESIDLEVKDSAGAIVEPNPEYFQEFLDVSVAHSGHYDPINVTWIWDYQEQGLPAGEYTITVMADNFQQSYSTSTDASFTIKKDGTGGEAQAGQSGILTFNNEQFESYQEGAGITDDDNDVDTDANSGGSEAGKKETPGPGILSILAGIGAILAYCRRF